MNCSICNTPLIPDDKGIAMHCPKCKGLESVKPAPPPITISPEAREAARCEILREEKINPWYPNEQGHFVQQLLDAQKLEIQTLRNTAVAAAKDLIKERKQLSSLRVISEELANSIQKGGLVTAKFCNFNCTYHIRIMNESFDKYHQWLTLNPETKNV